MTPYRDGAVQILVNFFDLADTIGVDRAASLRQAWFIMRIEARYPLPKSIHSSLTNNLCLRKRGNRTKHHKK